MGLFISLDPCSVMLIISQSNSCWPWFYWQIIFEANGSGSRQVSLQVSSSRNARPLHKQPNSVSITRITDLAQRLNKIGFCNFIRKTSTITKNGAYKVQESDQVMQRISFQTWNTILEISALNELLCIKRPSKPFIANTE